MWLTIVFSLVFGQKLWSMAAWHHQTITRPERGSSQSGTWKVLIYVTG